MLLSALLTSKAAAAAVGAVLLAGGAAASVAVPVALAGSHGPSASSTDDTTDDATDESTESVDPTTDEPTTDDPSTATDESTSAAPDASATQGPDAAGPAAYGLCTAWAHGGLTQAKADAGNPAAAALVAAAGDGTVEDYCAQVYLDKKRTPEATATADSTDAPSTEAGARGKAKAAEKKAGHGKPAGVGQHG